MLASLLQGVVVIVGAVPHGEWLCCLSFNRDGGVAPTEVGGFCRNRYLAVNGLVLAEALIATRYPEGMLASLLQGVVVIVGAVPSRRYDYHNILVLNHPQIPNENPGNRSIPAADLIRYKTRRPNRVEKVKKSIRKKACINAAVFCSARLNSRRFRPNRMTK